MAKKRTIAIYSIARLIYVKILPNYAKPFYANYCCKDNGIFYVNGVLLFSQEYTCAMLDQCPPFHDEEQVYELLMHNFRRHYNSNRAPFGLFFHTIWFKYKKNARAFEVRSHIAMNRNAFTVHIKYLTKWSIYFKMYLQFCSVY